MATLEKAIKTYGKDMQLNVAIEELSELIKEICKHKRGKENRDAIIEEMADCLIVIDQMGIIFDISDEELFEMYTQKVKRLKKRLEEESEK